MKLTIEIWGKGSEAFLHKITEDQFETLAEGGIEDDEMDHDEVSEVLQLDTFLDTDDIVSGVYHDSFTIKVIDENGLVVWESDNYEFGEYEEKYLYNDDKYLMIDDYQKGNFFNYQLEIEDDFDPTLLVAETTELLDGVLELITGIKYGDIEMDKDYGDTISKGFNYSLI
jgi:hypothetical protein